MLKSFSIMMKYYYYRAIIFLILSALISEKTFALTPNTNNTKPLIVVIDPGHGGKDPGAVSKGVREKDVVLAIGKKLGQYINESFPDVKVIYTRNTDVFVPLIDRSKIANKNKADLFISIHANFCGTPSTRGTETFCLGVARSDDNLDVAKKENSVILLEEDYSVTYEGFDPNSYESYIMFEMAQETYMKQSLSFADAIQNQFKNNLESSNRGVKQAGFLVLRLSSMPSVLIETGFLSNASEAKYLSSEAGQQTIAQSVFEAFKHFKAKNSGSNGSVMADNKTVPADQKNSTNTITKSEDQDKKSEIVPVLKTEEKSKEKKSEPLADVQKSQDKPDNTATERNDEKPEINHAISGNTFYSVQIGANTTPVEPIAANFKGLKEVRREKTDKYYRYFIGKELSVEGITPIWYQIKLKFPQAFIVSFVDGKRIILDSNLNK